MRKSKQLFRKNNLIVKKTQILVVLRNFVFSNAFCIKNATFSSFKKARFFQKTCLLFLKKAKNWTFCKFLNFPSHSTAKMLLWATWKNSFFSPKSHPIFLKQPKLSTFQESLLSQSLSTAKFLHSALRGFERLQYFLSKNPSIFFEFKFQIWMFWEVLLIQSHSAANLLPNGILKKNQGFFLKTPALFCWRRPIFERFEKFYCLSRFLLQIFYP